MHPEVPDGRLTELTAEAAAGCKPQLHCLCRPRAAASIQQSAYHPAHDKLHRPAAIFAAAGSKRDFFQRPAQKDGIVESLSVYRMPEIYVQHVIPYCTVRDPVQLQVILERLVLVFSPAGRAAEPPYAVCSYIAQAAACPCRAVLHEAHRQGSRDTVNPRQVVIDPDNDPAIPVLIPSCAQEGEHISRVHGHPNKTLHAAYIAIFLKLPGTAGTQRHHVLRGNETADTGAGYISAGIRPVHCIHHRTYILFGPLVVPLLDRLLRRPDYFAVILQRVLIFLLVIPEILVQSVRHIFQRRFRKALLPLAPCSAAV